jgi:hypothetical protein
MDPLEPLFDDASHLFRGGATLHSDGPAVLGAVQTNPDDERAWAKLTGWLNDNGNSDEAEAVRVFWPTIADTIRGGMPFGQAMQLLAKHAPGLAKLSRRLEH